MNTTEAAVISETEVREIQIFASQVLAQVEQAVEGKSAAIMRTILTLLAGGHLLIEDVPGTGKTLLAKSLAAALGLNVNRVQFTPDLLPGDITGTSVFNQASRDFEFKAGAVFTNLLLADEINRASAKTQSALLEAMEERKITVDAKTYALPDPFMVLATSNPVEMDGTFDLPEAQRDRFMVRISMGYPDPQAEVRMLANHAAGASFTQLSPVATDQQLRNIIAAVQRVHVSTAVMNYVVQLANATRNHAAFTLGVSPRAVVHAVKVAKAHAALQGRNHVLPQDVQAVLLDVWAHRLHLKVFDADASSPKNVLQDILAKTQVLG